MKYLMGLWMVFMLTTYGQQRYLVTPSDEAIPLRQGESALEAAKRAGILSSGNDSRGFNPQQFPTEIEFPAYHKMVVGMRFTAPATGSLDTIFWMGGECGAAESLVYIRFHGSIIGDDWGPGIPPYPPACQPWGYWKNIYDYDQGVAAFWDDATDTTWYSTIKENQNGQVVPKTRPPCREELWGCGIGFGVYHRKGVNKFALMEIGLPLNLNVGDKFFISMKVNSLNQHGYDLGKPTTFPASVTNAPYPSRAWAFYEHPGESYGTQDPWGLQMPCCGVSPAPKGWIAMGGPTGKGDAMVFNWWYVMTAISDVPPSVVQFDKLGHTFSTSPRTVTAEIIDSNPSHPESAGVASAYLVYSINNNPKDSVLMTNTSGDVWSADLPGTAVGSEILYYLTVTDIKGNRTSDNYDKYKVLASANEYYVIDPYAIYQWEEINTTGTKVTDWLPQKTMAPPWTEAIIYPDSSTSGVIDLGVGFKLLGSDIRYAWIGVDGIVCFSSSLDDTNRIDKTYDYYPSYAPEIPCDLFQNIIAPMFKKFNIKKHGAVYYQAIGSKFIIEWDSVCAEKDYSDTTTTFEVVLDRSDNSITFLYKDIGKYLASGDALVALQTDHTNWMLANRNGSPPETELHNGYAVKFLTNNILTNMWGMYSAPVILSDSLKDKVFINATSDAFTYVDGGYIPQTYIKSGVGYWLRLIGNHYAPLEGEQILLDTIPVVEGWNMIGSISVPVQTSSITSDPPGITTSDFFGYSGSYIISDTIYPANGYWVKVNQPGSLILSSTPPLQTFARIRIVPTSDSPPSPPYEKMEINEIPKEFSLSEAYPNPFNPSTIIRYQLPVNSRVTLKIYNLLGQEVVTLIDEFQDAGFKSVEWDGREISSGLYIYRLEATSVSNPNKTFRQVRKMILLR